MRSLDQKEAWGRRGGGSGGSGAGTGTSGSGGGNSVAVPQPVNEAPGLNAIWVFGQNMQGALGLNHQVAIGSNQQICINPAGLMAGMVDTGAADPLMSGLLGGSAGGNLQLTFGSNVALTMGQSFQINLGPPGITVDGDGKYRSHGVTFVLGCVIGVLAAAYAVLYHYCVSQNAFATCGTVTMVYQLAVDAVLETIMIAETLISKVSDSGKKAWNTGFVLNALSDGLSAPATGAAGVLAAVGTGAAFAALIGETLLATLLDAREQSEQHPS